MWQWSNSRTLSGAGAGADRRTVLNADPVAAIISTGIGSDSVNLLISSELNADLFAAIRFTGSGLRCVNILISSPNQHSVSS